MAIEKEGERRGYASSMDRQVGGRRGLVSGRD